MRGGGHVRDGQHAAFRIEIIREHVDGDRRVRRHADVVERDRRAVRRRQAQPDAIDRPFSTRAALGHHSV